MGTKTNKTTSVTKNESIADDNGQLIMTLNAKLSEDGTVVFSGNVVNKELYLINKEDTKQATTVFVTAAMDMVGREFEITQEDDAK